MEENQAITFTPPITSTEPVKRSRLPLLLGVLFAVLAIGGLAYYILHAKNTSSQIEEAIAPNETYLQLKNKPDFISAREASLKGNYAEAVELYKKVIPTATGEYSYLQYEIAANTLSLDGPKGIKAFGELIASSSINFENKAYSLVVLTNYYSLLRSTSTLPLIQLSANSWQETVNKEHLAMLQSAQTPDDVRTALMEMSVSLYQTSGAHVLLGYLYARKAQEVYTNNPEDKATLEEYVEKAKTHLAVADSDPDKTRESENLRSTVPAILMRKGLALGILERLEAKENGASLVFENAIELAIQEKTIVPFFYYNYALYLASRQETDQEKIYAILVKIVEMKDSRAFPVFQEYIRNLLKNPSNNETLLVKKLFVIYPPFEEAVR